jgi:hypothetical protein
MSFTSTKGLPDPMAELHAPSFYHQKTLLNKGNFEKYKKTARGAPGGKLLMYLFFYPTFVAT